ncbi:MAG TPA: hypothetical protein VGX96_20735 [Candidatus Elarobacter sp.]|nr:hypothetical protein [Candidatus Elarobacter sp.]
MKTSVALAAVAFALAASACAQNRVDPQVLADQTTRSVYDADFNGTTSHFDDAAKAQVTRASLGELSDKMRALGAYHGLKQNSAEPDTGRYVYEAAFDKGTMLIELRLDPNQQIAAYRIVPQANGTPVR